MSLHYPVGLKKPSGAYALLSDLNGEEVTRAIVFVHGFMGDPYQTWIRFQEMIDGSNRDWWAASDLFFFTYDSVNNPVGTSSLELRNLLRVIYAEPESDVFEVGLITPKDQISDASDIIQHRLGTTRYSELVLVGHSEGGLVLRHAIAEIARQDLILGDSPDDTSSMLSGSLRLFAPAIAGISVAGLKGIASQTPGIRTAARMFLGKSSAYNDMQPSAVVLKETRLRTERLSEKHHHPAFRAHVIWAAHDQVVAQQGYLWDKEAIWYGTDHRGVCKPSYLNDSPLSFVEHGL